MSKSFRIFLNLKRGSFFLVKVTNNGYHYPNSKLNLGCLGLEPRTIRLKAEYSTIELATLSFYCNNKNENNSSYKKNTENI